MHSFCNFEWHEASNRFPSIAVLPKAFPSHRNVVAASQIDHIKELVDVVLLHILLSFIRIMIFHLRVVLSLSDELDGCKTEPRSRPRPRYPRPRPHPPAEGCPGDKLVKSGRENPYAIRKGRLTKP